VLRLQTIGQGLQGSLGAQDVVHPPRLVELAADEGVLLGGQMVHDVPALVQIMKTSS